MNIGADARFSAEDANYGHLTYDCHHLSNIYARTGVGGVSRMKSGE